MIFDRSAEAARVHDEKHVERAGLGSVQHRDASRPVADRCTADALILETADDGPALGIGVFRAHAHLVGDARLGLLVGAEPAVDGCSHLGFS